MHEKVVAVTGVTVSKNRKYLACVEVAEEAETHQITVYSIQTLKRVKTLVPDVSSIQSSEVISISFRCSGWGAFLFLQGQ